MSQETHAETFHDAIEGKTPHTATLTIWAADALPREALEEAGDVLRDAMAAIEQVLFDEFAYSVTVEMVGPSADTLAEGDTE